MTHILASMVPTIKCMATHLTAGEHSLLLGQLPLHHHIPTQQCLLLLPTEASCRDENRAVPARPGVTNLLTAVPFAGQQALTRPAAGHRRAPVRAPPHNNLFPTGTRTIRRKCLAGRARTRVALENADVRAPCGVSIITLGGRLWLLKRLGAGLPARVGREEEIVGRIPSAPAEAGVVEVAGGSGEHGLAPGAAPGGGRGGLGGAIGDGSRGARPLADAGEVEDGVAAAAGPDGRRPPHHVVADHALHRAPRQLVLDLLHQLRHRPISPDGSGSGSRSRRRRALVGGGSRGALREWPRPLLTRPAAIASRVPVEVLLRRWRAAAVAAPAGVVVLRRRRAAWMMDRAVTVLLRWRVAAIVVVVVVPLVGAARASLGRAGLRCRVWEWQDRGVGARGGCGVGARDGAGAPHGAGGLGRGAATAAAIGGGLHAAAGREG